MTKPHRVQLSRAKGWRMPENTVKVDRSTKWGNPFNFKRSEHCWTALALGFKGDGKGRQAASVHAFRYWLQGGRGVHFSRCGLYAEVAGDTVPISESPDAIAPPPPSIATVQAELRGKNLACWCALDAPCHADVLLELANSEAAQ